MKKNELYKYKNMITESFDIIDNLIIKTSYPTVIMDRDYQIIFVNSLALKLYDTSFEETYMKNYLGLYCNNDEEYQEFTDFYNEIKIHKKPVYVDNSRNNSYIMVFPILSPNSGEVIYFHNIFIVEEFHMTEKQIDDLIFNLDFAHFAHQISILLENKDRYTANHSSNVSRYCAILGEEIGLDGIQLKKLKLSAGLHDIGKVSISNNILNKNGKLDLNEYEQIIKHSYYSGKILEVLHKFSDVASAALYHHERYDGKGYPEGISGRDIPIFARIISIADSFDAMTTDRPYRKAMTIEKALNELIENKYTQFDPFLVDKFTNIDLKTIMNSLSDFDSQYTDKHTISELSFEQMSNKLKDLLREIDPFCILKNLVDYNLYGLIISRDLNTFVNAKENRFEFIYQSELVDNLCADKFITGNWEICLKEKKFARCNHCPADGCISLKSTYSKKSKLINDKGDTKYLNTLLYPIFDEQHDDTYIIEILRDVTVHTRYSNTTAAEFFNFTDNISRIFAKQHKEFSIIYNKMRDLSNWIAEKVGISDHKIELLNRALSICDLGVLALIDSNEYSFKNIQKLRLNKKHIDIIHTMISNLETFEDISDIVLYHHTDYNDTTSRLYGNSVPIQSYIISTSDLLLTYTIMGKPILETIKYVESMSGILGSPQVCDTITSEKNKDELIAILHKVALLSSH